MDYKTAGVDVTAGRAFVERIKSCVEKTHKREVIGGLGGFGGCIRIPKGYESPVLVSGTDGVGTKLELAQKYGFLFGVGIDLVAMCANDEITNGARPLFFLDYIATGKLDKKKLLRVVQGISYGCRENNCSLLGGETAEMPGFYSNKKYDLAGFCVGIVDEDKLINGKKISENDLIIALKSNGVHSNGFSLVRKIIQNNNQLDKEFEKVSHLIFLYFLFYLFQGSLYPKDLKNYAALQAKEYKMSLLQISLHHHEKDYLKAHKYLVLFLMISNQLLLDLFLQ